MATSILVRGGTYSPLSVLGPPPNLACTVQTHDVVSRMEPRASCKGFIETGAPGWRWNAQPCLQKWEVISLGAHPGETCFTLTLGHSYWGAWWELFMTPSFSKEDPRGPRKVSRVSCMTQEVNSWAGPWTCILDFTPPLNHVECGFTATSILDSPSQGQRSQQNDKPLGWMSLITCLCLSPFPCWESTRQSPNLPSRREKSPFK